MSAEVLGLDADGAELRVGDKVQHSFGPTGSITGITRALADSGLLDKFNIVWDCSPSEAPASTASSQHVRKLPAAAATMPGARVTQQYTGAEYESGALHRARGVNDAEAERLREREGQEPLSPPRAPACGTAADEPSPGVR